MGHLRDVFGFSEADEQDILLWWDRWGPKLHEAMGYEVPLNDAAWAFKVAAFDLTRTDLLMSVRELAPDLAGQVAMDLRMLSMDYPSGDIKGRPSKIQLLVHVRYLYLAYIDPWPRERLETAERVVSLYRSRE